jgi:hypothetical protein
MKHKVCRYCMHQHLKVRGADSWVVGGLSTVCLSPRGSHSEFSEE